MYTPPNLKLSPNFFCNPMSIRNLDALPYLSIFENSHLPNKKGGYQLLSAMLTIAWSSKILLSCDSLIGTLHV